MDQECTGDLLTERFPLIGIIAQLSQHTRLIMIQQRELLNQTHCIIDGDSRQSTGLF